MGSIKKILKIGMVMNGLAVDVLLLSRVQTFSDQLMDIRKLIVQLSADGIIRQLFISPIPL